MAYETYETINRLWQKFLKDQLATIAPEERQKFEQLLKNVSMNCSRGLQVTGQTVFLTL